MRRKMISLRQPTNPNVTMSRITLKVKPRIMLPPQGFGHFQSGCLINLGVPIGKSLTPPQDTMQAEAGMVHATVEVLASGPSVLHPAALQM